MKKRRYLLGYDIGSSSVKAALIDADTGEQVGVAQSPQGAMPMDSDHHGWAEQDPGMWWAHLCTATKNLLLSTGVAGVDIEALGIAYQMHGLVCIDDNLRVVRPSIIWCDSRAVEIGERAFEGIGREYCMQHLLNSPGNFTASKLSWVRQYQPDIYNKIYKILLPGDFIAMKLTGEVMTTPSGLSEGMFWDFIENDISDEVLRYFGFSSDLFGNITPSFSWQGSITEEAAKETGLKAGIPVTYRAGDQPNNALCLNVLDPGEVAASGGTSGVVYGVVDTPVYDPQQRVNCFMHVNHKNDMPRIGILLCINGAGSQYHWIKQNIAASNSTFAQMEQEAGNIPVGSEGLCILPFGNGAERLLENADPGAQILHLDFNRHNRAHVYRAALEGIAFAFAYGTEVMKKMGQRIETIKVGNDNLFRSGIFSATIATLLGCRIEVVSTTGAVGAAIAAGVQPGIYGSVKEALTDQYVMKMYAPQDDSGHFEAYENWKRGLPDNISRKSA